MKTMRQGSVIARTYKGSYYTKIKIEENTQLKVQMLKNKKTRDIFIEFFNDHGKEIVE